MKKSVKITLVVSTLILLATAAWWFILPRFNGNFQQGGLVDSSAFIKPVPRLYGMAVDSFKVEHNKVGRDQNLGQILQQ